MLLGVLLWAGTSCVRSNDALDPAPATSPPQAVDLLDEDFKQPEPQKSTEPANRLKRAQAAAAFAFGQKLEDAQRFQQALERYQQAAEADPDYTPTYSRIALIYLKSDQIQTGTQYLEAKLKTHPNAARLHSLLAYCYQESNKPVEAVRQARLALSLDFTLASNYNVLVKCLPSKGKKNAVLELLAESEKYESGDPSYYVRMGDIWNRLLYESGAATGAKLQELVLPFYEKAGRLDPENPHLLFQLGQLSFDMDKFDVAAEYYTKAYEKNRHIPALRERLAISLLSLHQEAKAIQVLESLLEDFPERKSLYPMIAELYGRNNQWDRAAEYYQLYVQLGSPDAKDYLQLADAQIQAHKPEKALASLELAAKDYSNVPEIPFLKALVLRSLNRGDESLTCFSKAEELGRDKQGFCDSNFYFQYGVAAGQNGAREKAASLLDKSLKLNPDNHQALNYLGYMWAERGENLDEAEKLISRALKLVPGNEAYLDSMGWVCFQKGDYQKAVPYLEKAIQGAPDDPAVLEHLADAYYKVGQASKAIETWSKASPLAKDPKPLQAKIQQAREQSASKP